MRETGTDADHCNSELTERGIKEREGKKPQGAGKGRRRGLNQARRFTAEGRTLVNDAGVLQIVF